MNKKELITRIDHLISTGQKVLSTRQHSSYGSDYVNLSLQIGFRTASLSFIKNLYGENHIFFKDFEDRVRGSAYYETENGINILSAIKHEVENDWLTSLQQLVSAEIFSDFLEMGKHLLDNNYKDPAAVVIGSVLEEHLRRLCKNHSIETTVVKGDDVIPKKADLLNADLTKATVYNTLQQKNVTAWLDLRNKAAHGKYTEYSKQEVELMYNGVLFFVTSVT